MIIAVDFDGTIVEHRYPEIGNEIPFAILTLKKLQADRHRLILWTVREGKLLDDAVAFCRERGLEFYAVNANFPEELCDACQTPCRKVSADLFIDDCNCGGIPDWAIIYKLIHEKLSYKDYLRSTLLGQDHSKQTVWQKVFGKKNK